MKKILTFLLACLLAFACTTAMANDLPLVDQPVKLTIWRDLGDKAATVMTSWNEMAFVPILTERTNVQIEFIHPPIGGETEQLNTMIATRNLPDVISTNWDDLTGGPAYMIQEEIIIPLNDLIDQYAPNLKALWEEHPDWKADAMTDDGDIVMFPHYWCETQNCHFGFVVRDDWARKLNVALPDTVDEWYIYLKAVKEGDPNGNGEHDELGYVGVGMDALKDFQKAFGIRENSLFYVENGRIVCAVEQPTYKEWISTMKQWYQEGLIDPEILSTTRANLDAKVLSDKAATLWSGAGTGQLGLYLKQKDMAGDKEFSLYPVKNPLTEAGERLATYKTVYGFGTAITTACTNPELAVKLMDYFYSEEGRRLAFLGEEGKCYVPNEDGGITFTEYVTNNPDGLSFDSALIQNGAAPWGFPGVQFPEYWAQNTSFYPQQVVAYDQWSDVTVDKELPCIRFTQEEANEISYVLNDINTLLNETLANIITGEMEVSQFDKTVEQMNAMGLQTLKGIYQDAYERYASRGK